MCWKQRLRDLRVAERDACEDAVESGVGYWLRGTRFGYGFAFTAVGETACDEEDDYEEREDASTDYSYERSYG